MANNEDLLIVNPPFANITYPALGPSLLTVGCRKRNITSKVYYANLRLAARIGYDLYRHISLSSATDLLGEALFSEWALNEKPQLDQARGLVQRILTEADNSFFQRNDLTTETLFAILPDIEATIDECVQEILDHQPRIVGFTSVFQQTMSSLAIAQRLKRLNPNIHFSDWGWKRRRSHGSGCG